MTAIALALVLAAAPTAKTAQHASFGIGSIVWENEGTDAAFEAFHFFRDHPPRQKGVETKPALIELSTDADWALEGKLQGSVQSVLRPRPYTISLVATSISGVVTGAAAIGYLASSLPVFLVIGAISLPVLLISAIAMAATQRIVNDLDGSVRGEFILKRKGVQVATFKPPPVEPRDSFGDEPPDPGRSRDALLAPMFSQLKVKIEAEMKKAPVEAQ